MGDKAQDIYNQVSMVAERTKSLGASLSASQNHFNKLVDSLVGQKGLAPKVERFSQFSSKASRTLEAPDPINVSTEDQRLTVIRRDTDD